MGRRDSNDAEWKKVKEFVRKRDSNTCRLMMVITAKQGLYLKKNGSGLLDTLDPAHVFPVSTHPKLCYEPDNVVILNRYSHNMLDSGRDPIMGNTISYNERMRWWELIAGPLQWDHLQELITGEKNE